MSLHSKRRNQTMNTRTLISLVIGGLAMVAANAQSSGLEAHGSQKGPAGHAQIRAKPVQKVTIIVDNGFSPSTVKVKAGQPVQLTFDVKHRGYASTVVFQSLKITKELNDGKKTVITFTPSKAGTIAYACGMNMLKGSIVVK